MIEARQRQDPDLTEARQSPPRRARQTGAVTPALTGLLLSCLLVGCGTLSERQASYGVHARAAPQVSEPIASPAMTEFQIARAQVLLTDLGYRPGPANGLVEPDTEAAVRAFQEYEGLSVDGRVSNALLAQLEVADRALSTRRAQVRLLALGYDPGPIDGTVGPRTRAAISVYQQDRGLPVRGDVTEELLQHLRDEQPAPLPRSRSADELGQAMPGATPSATTPSGTPAPKEAAASLSAIATAAGGAPAGAPDGAGPPSNLVDLEAAAPADSWGAAGSDEQRAPAPVLPEELQSAASAAAGPATPPIPTISLAALPGDAGRAGQPLAPGDRIRLAVGSGGADIIEREIDAAGELALPGGLTVAAAGLTLPELKRAITVKLVESYLNSLSVEVSRSGEPPGSQGTQ